MLKDLFQNRLFIGALAFFALCVGGSLLYMQHVAQQGAEELAETQDRVAQWNEKQKPKPTETAPPPVGETSQGGHFHEDGTWHAEPHETPSLAEVDTPKPVQVSGISAPQREYDRGSGNPLPYGNVDIRDFEAAKVAMIENINFIKANWDPEAFFDKELGRELRVAYARATNIANAAMSGIYTREQAREMNALYYDLGISDMIGNAADEIVQGHGVK